MHEAERRVEIFERAPVPKAICTQIIPAIASQMIALIYNLADTYFVGMLNDPNQTAAVTVVSTGVVFLTAISNLFGVGGASMVALPMPLSQSARIHVAVRSGSSVQHAASPCPPP